MNNNKFSSLSIDDNDDDIDHIDDNNEGVNVDDDKIVDKIALILGKQTIDTSIPWQLMVGSYERNEKTYDNVNDYTNNVIWIGSGCLSLVSVDNFIAFNCYIDWIHRNHNDSIRNNNDITCQSSGARFNGYNNSINTSFKHKIFRSLALLSDVSLLIGYPEVGVTVNIEELLSAALYSNLSLIDSDCDSNVRIDIIIPTPVSIKCRHIVAEAFDTAKRLLPSNISSKTVLNSVRSTAAALAISFIQTLKARKLLQARNGKIRICIVEIGEEYICTSFCSLESISSIVVDENNINKNREEFEMMLSPHVVASTTSIKSSKKKKKKKKGVNASITPTKDAEIININDSNVTPISQSQTTEKGSTGEQDTIIPAVVRIESSSGTCTFGLRDADMQLIQLWFLEIYKLIGDNDDNNLSAMSLWNRLDSKIQDTCLQAVLEFRIMKVDNLRITIPVKSSKSSSSSSSSSHAKYHPSFTKLCDKLINSIFYNSCKPSLNSTKPPFPCFVNDDDARQALERAFLYYGGKININDNTKSDNKLEINGNNFELCSLNTLLRQTIKSAIKGQQMKEPASFTQKGELIETPDLIDTVITWQEGHGSAYNIVTDHYNIGTGCIIGNVIRNIVSDELSGLVKKDTIDDNTSQKKAKNEEWKVGDIVVDAFATGFQLATGLVPTTNKKTSNKDIAEKLIQSMTCHTGANELPEISQTQWFELSASLAWEGLARLQIMDSICSAQNPCIRVFESLPFPLGLLLRVGNTTVTYQSNIVWLLDVDTMNRRKDKNLKSLDSIREDVHFYLQSNSKEVSVYEMKRNSDNVATTPGQDELFLIGNLVLPLKLATEEVRLSFVQLADANNTNTNYKKDKGPSLNLCTFDIRIDTPYYLSIQRYGGLNSFSLQKAVDNNDDGSNNNTTFINLSPNPIRRESKVNDSQASFFIGLNRSLIIKVIVIIVIIMIIVHTIATVIAATSTSLM